MQKAKGGRWNVRNHVGIVNDSQGLNDRGVEFREFSVSDSGFAEGKQGVDITEDFLQIGN